jgi:hypothetical protein
VSAPWGLWGNCCGCEKRGFNLLKSRRSGTFSSLCSASRDFDCLARRSLTFLFGG